VITSLKVCTESKYTEPANNVSADTGTAVVTNTMNREVVIVTRIDEVIGTFKKQKRQHLVFPYS
jgi:hypothetical protein